MQGNTKAGFYCAHLHCLTHDTTRYFTRSKQSRDAKSCVSQARRRMNIGNYMPFIAMMIPRETQDFASLLGWRQHIFSTKQAALDNMKSKLSLHSLALFLNKTGCARQYESKLSLFSLALFLNKTGCARQYESKLSLLSLALFLYHEEYSLKSEKHVQTINTNLTA